MLSHALAYVFIAFAMHVELRCSVFFSKFSAIGATPRAPMIPCNLDFAALTTSGTLCRVPSRCRDNQRAAAR